MSSVQIADLPAVKKVLADLCGRHKFGAKPNKMHRQNIKTGHLPRSIQVEDVMLPVGTKYAIFHSPKYLEGGQANNRNTLCTFFLRDRQVSITDDGRMVIQIHNISIWRSAYATA